MSTQTIHEIESTPPLGYAAQTESTLTVPPLCRGGMAIGLGCNMTLYIVQLPPHMLGWTAWLLVKESNGRSGSMLSYWLPSFTIHYVLTTS